MIGRKMINKSFDAMNANERFGLLASGVVGSLIYTFSDTFWFSAVEAEVYAMSSFFTAIVVWAAFKWELVEDTEWEYQGLLQMFMVITQVMV